jgi:hypothetical protein
MKGAYRSTLRALEPDALSVVQSDARSDSEVSN